MNRFGNTSFQAYSVQLGHAISTDRTRIDWETVEALDSLSALLKILEPGLSSDKLVDFFCQLDQEQYEALVDEARRQGLSALLYPMLVGSKNSFSPDFPQKEQLHRSYLATAVQNTLIMHDTELLLSSLQKAGIPAAGLKGVFLLENVYADPGARPMNDIDILVRKQDLGTCMHVLEQLGYSPTSYFSLSDQNIDTKHVPPMQKKGGALVEVHWTLLEEDEPFSIDFDALWDRMKPTRIANVDALSLGVEDLILHLCLHLTYQHYLQLGLRGLLDIALVIHKFRMEIDWTKLVQISKTWGSERVTALTLKLVETLLNVPIPSEVYASLLPEGIDPELIELARSQLLDRERFEDRLTPDMVELNATKNILKKLKIGLQRVFIPRIALARIYNVSPNSIKIVGFYWERLKYLVRNYGSTLLRLLKREEISDSALKKAETSYSLHDWMSKR